MTPGGMNRARCPAVSGAVGHTSRSIRVMAALLICLLIPSSLIAQAQGDARGATRPGYRRPSLIILFGIAEPLSRDGLTDFWLRGPVGSAAFTVDVSRFMALGVGVDVSVFYFDMQAFSERYPDVPTHVREIGIIDVYLLMRFAFRPGMVLSPYVTVTIGASHSTGATYKKEDPLPRQIYYDVPRSTRLAMGLAAGADIVVARWLTFVLEAKLSYVHNDPNIGLLASLRVGFRFRL